MELINHLLSHMFIARKETESQIDVGSSNFQIEVEQETLQEKDMRRIKPRPRYKNKFNRRDRSPTTENIQKEFTKDPKTERYHCNFCRNVYIRKQSVELHLSREHDPRKVSRRFSHEINDLEFSLDPKTNKFSCKICSNTYKYKQSVERHLVSQHNVVVPKIRLTNGITSSLKKSSSCPEKEKDKLLMCDWCGQSFKFRESLRKHLLRHVASEPKRNNADKVAREKIVCDQCTKLVNPSLMKRHFQVHHSDYRPFRCEEPGCSTTFFDVTKFNDHKNIHLKIKPHICEFCQESFHYASNLRQHKLRHTDPERFKCDICSHCFVSTKSLRLHMRLHTEVDPDAPKPFVCSYEGCFKAFTYSDRLKLHIFNVHRTESEYKCRLLVIKGILVSTLNSLKSVIFQMFIHQSPKKVPYAAHVEDS